MSRILLKYHTNIRFYTQYTHPMLICRGTDGWTDGRTDGRTDGWTDRQTDRPTDERMDGKYLLNIQGLALAPRGAHIID